MAKSKNNNDKKMTFLELIGLLVIILAVGCVVEPDLYSRGIKYLYSKSANNKIVIEERSSGNVENEKNSCVERNNACEKVQEAEIPKASIIDSEISICKDKLKDDIWNELKEKEKIKVIGIIVRIEKDYLGISKEIGLKVKNLNKKKSSKYYTYGTFCEENQIIYIDPRALEDSTELIDTVAHELFHVYQMEVSEIVQESEENYNLYHLKEIGITDLMKNGYKEADKNGFKNYYDQQYEKSARSYSKKRMTFYKG